MPWALIETILGFAVVAVTQVAYEVEGWGVGELVVSDERVVWHELPWPRAERLESGEAGGSMDPSLTPTHPGHGARAVVSQETSRIGGGFVTDVVQMLHAYFAGDQVPLETVPSTSSTRRRSSLAARPRSARFRGARS